MKSTNLLNSIGTTGGGGNQSDVPKRTEVLSNEGSSDSAKSDNTNEQIEKEIEQKDMRKIAEEVCTRERYKFKLNSVFKRYFACYDDENDEIVKKIRSNGSRKLQNELDISKMLRKIRNYEILNSYLLTERQRFLLRFNYRHVIDSDSDQISLASAQSLFSDPVSEENGKEKSQRHRVMMKLLADNDVRNPDCAYRQIDNDLKKGVNT